MIDKLVKIFNTIDESKLLLPLKTIYVRSIKKKIMKILI